MNSSMYNQVLKFSNRKSIIIKNFIDEELLEKFFKKNIRVSKKMRFVFVGSLISRKGILELIDSFHEVLKQDNDAQLDIIGIGPLMKKIQKKIKDLNIKSKVKIHGFLKSPYKLLSNSDVFVLPSYSEGTSRAALEALFLGIPVILRNVDGNDELTSKQNILLFNNNKDLASIMIDQAKYSKSRKSRKNLLPSNYRKKQILLSYLKTLNH